MEQSVSILPRVKGVPRAGRSAPVTKCLGSGGRITFFPHPQPTSCRYSVGVVLATEANARITGLQLAAVSGVVLAGAMQELGMWSSLATTRTNHQGPLIGKIISR